jgi:hypothetical protein
MRPHRDFCSVPFEADRKAVLNMFERFSLSVVDAGLVIDPIMESLDVRVIHHQISCGSIAGGGH